MRGVGMVDGTLPLEVSSLLGLEAPVEDYILICSNGGCEKHTEKGGVWWR